MAFLQGPSPKQFEMIKQELGENPGDTDRIVRELKAVCASSANLPAPEAIAEPWRFGGNEQVRRLYVFPRRGASDMIIRFGLKKKLHRPKFVRRRDSNTVPPDSKSMHRPVDHHRNHKIKRLLFTLHLD
ncbi:hypothetical protein EVAR_57099_1 [Eumeta japonica]|uniref:Uncharacterized protein n=1 Tax=Eumeta variegata TaxID=151549 RepID=A0A4C1YKK7_EUMVA|nr:hypothetical protein EVAR_57099_1 [Eumeta japonica]